MNRCCDNIQFTWEQDGDDGMVLVCRGCGAVWRPEQENEPDIEYFNKLDMAKCWVQLAVLVDNSLKKSLTIAKIKEMMLDSIATVLRERT